MYIQITFIYELIFVILNPALPTWNGRRLLTMALAARLFIV